MKRLPYYGIQHVFTFFGNFTLELCSKIEHSQISLVNTVFSGLSFIRSNMTT